MSNVMTSTIETEDKYLVPFFVPRCQLSIERGEGIFVYDESGRRYIDLTAGWGVTAIGHASPVITEALVEQSRKIIQNPNSGITYSPARARLLQSLHTLLPAGLDRIFFTNSGAEANDAAIKLARKASGRKNIISTYMSFHGRTISTVSATGQESHRDKYSPLVPNYLFVPFNDIEAMERVIDSETAAVIVEPIQGEGGVVVPSESYLSDLSALCRKHGAYLILDEIQTGFFRTGEPFCAAGLGGKVDMITMAKGIAGGFPFGAFAMSEEIASKLSPGDHGGTYCGNPLACAVSDAVINYMVEKRIGENVNKVGEYTFGRLEEWKERYPGLLKELRGRGLLIAIDFNAESMAAKIEERALERGMILNRKHGTIIRLFPALNITVEEMEEALDIMEDIIKEEL